MDGVANGFSCFEIRGNDVEEPEALDFTRLAVGFRESVLLAYVQLLCDCSVFRKAALPELQESA